MSSNHNQFILACVATAVVFVCCATFAYAGPLTTAAAASNERFAYLVAGADNNGGIQRSAKPAQQQYANDFLRLIFEEDYTVLMNFVCRPFYYDITDQNSLVYCKYMQTRQSAIRYRIIDVGQPAD